MYRKTPKTGVTIASLLAALALSACGTTAKTIDSGAELEKASVAASDSVVFGKFRLVRNGTEAKLGESIFANTATLHLYDVSEQRRISGQVGTEGEFAWVLAPGHYRVSAIDFNNRGENAEVETDFSFTVADGIDAIYVGTITLEATIDSGYFGLNGVVDSVTISDDCASDCAGRMARLGLAADSVVTALPQQEGGLARRN